MSISASLVLDFLTAVGALSAVILAWVIFCKETEINSRNIEASTRPILTFYPKHTLGDRQHYYLALKNFGASSAVITSLKLDNALPKLIYGDTVDMVVAPQPFQFLVGAHFPPGYEIVAELKSAPLEKRLSERYLEDRSSYVLQFQISYKSESGKEYSEHCTVNLSAIFGVTTPES